MMVAWWYLFIWTVHAEHWRLVATEGEQWSVLLDAKQPDQAFAFQAGLGNTEIWVENPYELSLFNTQPHSSVQPSTIPPKLFCFPDQKLLLACHGSTVQAFLVDQQYLLLWELSLGDRRILKLEQFWLDSEAFAFLLLDTASGLQVLRLHVTSSPEHLQPVHFPELDTADAADFVVLKPTQCSAFILSCTSGNSTTLHVYELSSSLFPVLRRSYSSLPGGPIYLQIRNMFSWACDLYVLEGEAGLLTFTLINFELIPFNLSANDPVSAVSFPQGAATHLALTTEHGLLLLSSISQSQQWLAGPVVAAEVVDNWVMGIWQRELGLRFEIFSLKWNRTEGSWPIAQAAPFHVIPETKTTSYTLIFNDDDAYRLYHLETGSRVLRGRAQPGHYHGSLQGAESTSLELEVLSVSNRSILCGHGYFLTSHLELELPLERKRLPLKLNQLFSGPDVRVRMSDGLSTVSTVPKLTSHWEQSFLDLKSGTTLESFLGDKLLFRSSNQIHIFQNKYQHFQLISSITIPGLQVAVLLNADFLALVTSFGRNYLRIYSTQSGQILYEQEVPSACLHLQTNDIYIACLSPTQVDIWTISLNLMLQITTKSLETEKVDFHAMEIMVAETGQMSVLVVCAINGLIKLQLGKGFSVENRLIVDAAMKDIVAMHVHEKSIVSILTTEGRIAIYELRRENLVLLRTLPTWDNDAPRHILCSEGFLGVVKQERLYLYNVMEPVHNSLFTSIPVRIPCSYFLTYGNLLELCEDTSKLSLWSISHFFLSPRYPTVFWTPVSDQQTQLEVQANNDMGASASVLITIKK
jgi:hypothetical protein